ncbi:MAG: hypothetical protein JWQ14_1424 [Adhaeribacter sp.]|nr:hypothetical protein [Adhaeribacter sp.]
MKTTIAICILFSLLFAANLPVFAQIIKPVKKKILPKVLPSDTLRSVLEQIYATDQGIRKKISQAPPADRMNLFREMRQIDSANQIKVKVILSQYGWLPQRQVGEKAASALFYVVQHADSGLMATYLPQLQKLARNGEAKTTHAAMMEDRLLMDRREKQIYGTQAFSNVLTKGVVLIWPIADYQHVNLRRKEAGFETTVEENAKRLGAIYKPTEIIPGLLAD